MKGKTAEADAAAHPRSRGENMLRRKSPAYMAGSSPLTRGKLHYCNCGDGTFGLIPAHAGKTTLQDIILGERGAHPRSRGENAVAKVEGQSQPGSSPLTRGKQALVRGAFAVGGLIPAHAGKTSQSDRLSGVDTAHPRSRGENLEVRFLESRGLGSSPLTRGKRLA